MHPTPLRVDKVGAFLPARIGDNPVSTYECVAGDGQTVRRQKQRHLLKRVTRIDRFSSLANILLRMRIVSL
jgi:hypothetical protein